MKKTINEENKMNAIAISIASAHFNTLAPLYVNACERKSRYTETGKKFTKKNARKKPTEKSEKMKIKKRNRKKRKRMKKEQKWKKYLPHGVI